MRDMREGGRGRRVCGRARMTTYHRRGDGRLAVQVQMMSWGLCLLSRRSRARLMRPCSFSRKATTQTNVDLSARLRGGAVWWSQRTGARQRIMPRVAAPTANEGILWYIMKDVNVCRCVV